MAEEPSEDKTRPRSNALLIISHSGSLSADNSLLFHTNNVMSENEIIKCQQSELSVDDGGTGSIVHSKLTNGCTENNSHSQTQPYVNIQLKTSVSYSGPDPKHTQVNGTSPRDSFMNSKLRLLDNPQSDGECIKCRELKGVVALWELGVSGLTRNYSKILSQLNKARESAIKLEAQMRDKTELPTASIGVRNLSVNNRKTVHNRASMYEPNLAPTSSITDRMYPQEEDNSLLGNSKYYKDLTTHLGEAIDLCQQLAAANFKSNQKQISKDPKLKRQPTMPSMPTMHSEEVGSNKPLQSIIEASLSGSYKLRSKLERSPSFPDEILRTNESERSVGSLQNEPTVDQATSSLTTQPSVVANQKPFYSHMMKLCSQDTLDFEKSMETSENSSNRSFDGEGLSSTGTFSDTDVKQIMSKIADLEEERLKLHNTIDDLHRDNNQVRLSFTEILGDLENKDLQLSLALHDLTLATGEIRRAAEMRRKLQEMENERKLLFERLNNLEDESAAVKVSLIQLLQQKSATNKTLALENWRLNQRIKTARANEDDDDVCNSGFNSVTEDATLQEAYIGADDVASFVHKQGFLVKQGGRRKNWKRRLFVLSPGGLSYFKTEQPIQIVPMDQITKVQICHGRTGLPHPHIFEVHIPGRVFLLSAPTEDDMQSWVGMIQTLKQYDKGTTLNREATIRKAAAIAAGTSQPSETHEPTSSPPETLTMEPHLPKELRIEILSSSEEVLINLKEVISSDDDSAFTSGATPMSVPTRTPLDDDDITLPRFKIRSDSS